MADINNVMNTPDTTAEYTQEDINSNRVMAILAYIGLLFLVPLFAAKDSKFARFHTNQGIVLCIAGAICYVACTILVALASIPAIGWLFAVLGYIGVTAVGIVFTILMVLGIVNAAKGTAKELPIIGKFKILK